MSVTSDYACPLACWEVEVNSLNDQDHNAQNANSARWGLIGNLFLTIIKLTVGILGNSRALIADGIHSGADLLSSAAVMVGLKISYQPPDEGHNYGHAKAEAVAQKVVALLLILTGYQIGANATHALFHPSSRPPSIITLVVASGAMALKWVMYRSQLSAARKTGSHALMASARDNRMDVLSSLIATLAIVGARLHIPHTDAIGALIVAGLVVWLGIEIFSQAANDLMDRSADETIVSAVMKAAHAVPGVLGVSTMRTRVSGTHVLVDMEIDVDRTLSLLAAHDIAHEVEEQVTAVPSVKGITVHVNPASPGASPSKKGDKMTHDQPY